MLRKKSRIVGAVKKLPPTRSCFCCGTENPIGLRFDLIETQGAVETRFQFKPEHCGFPGVVHGGLVTAALDELMAWAVGVSTGQFAYAAALEVRFVKPVAPGVELMGLGAVGEESRPGRLYKPWAEIRSAEGLVLARGEGRFMPLPPEAQEAMKAEFVGDASELFRPRGVL